MLISKLNNKTLQNNIKFMLAMGSLRHKNKDQLGN